MLDCKNSFDNGRYAARSFTMTDVPATDLISGTQRWAKMTNGFTF